MEMNIVTTPIIALDYLTKGERGNLTDEQIRIADDWAKDWEIVEVKNLSKEEWDEYLKFINNPTHRTPNYDFSDYEPEEYGEAV